MFKGFLRWSQSNLISRWSLNDESKTKTCQKNKAGKKITLAQAMRLITRKNQRVAENHAT